MKESTNYKNDANFRKIGLFKGLTMFSLKKIHHINNFFFSEQYQFDFPENLHPRVMKDLGRFPFVILWHLFFGFRPKRWFPGKNKVVFFFQSKNNYNTIKSIQEITPNSILLHTKPCAWAKGFLFPTGIAYLISLLFLPLALWHLLKSKGKQKIAFQAFFSSYLKTYGLLIAYEVYFRYLTPKAIILTNSFCRDHLIISGICKKKIPVFFIPHGSFANSGQRLKKNPMYFDIALVAGADQKNKIQEAIPNSRVYVIGRPISDCSVFLLNHSSTLLRLGIGVNPMDHYGNVVDLIALILENMNIEIIVRPHPITYSTKEASTILGIKNVCYSNSWSESPIEFLEKVDGIIASCSGILLDAAEMNVYPIFYDSSHRYNDFNNFVKNGLSNFVGSADECLKLLNKLSSHKPYIRDRAKYYNGVIDTEWDGNSSKLAKEIILRNIDALGSQPV